MVDKKEIIDAEVVKTDTSLKKDEVSSKQEKASPKKESTAKPKEVPAKTKTSGNGLLWLFWFLSTGILGAAVYNLYTAGSLLSVAGIRESISVVSVPSATSTAPELPDFDAMVAKAIEGKIAALAPATPVDNASNQEELLKLTESLTEKNKALTSTVSQVQKQNEQTVAALATIDTSLATVTASLDKQNENRALYKALPLVEDAVRMTDVQNKPKQAAMLLQAAAVVLHKAGDPQNLNKQQILSQAASDLLKLPSVDVVGLSKKVDVLMKDVPQLVLPGTKIETETETETKVEKNRFGSWTDAADNMWQDVQGLVKISKDGTDGMVKMVSPAAQSLAYMMAKLQLQRLQLAIASGNQEQFDDAYQATLSLVQNTFDTQNPQTQAFLTSLQTLSDMKVQMPIMPASMDAVRNLLKQGE